MKLTKCSLQFSKQLEIPIIVTTSYLTSIVKSVQNAKDFIKDLDSDQSFEKFEFPNDELLLVAIDILEQTSDPNPPPPPVIVHPVTPNIVEQSTYFNLQAELQALEAMMQ